MTRPPVSRSDVSADVGTGAGAQASGGAPARRGTADGSAARGHGFGTAPVFLASLSTILGAIMFLRFGYAVGHVGLIGSLAIIALGHLVTVPTALAIAEIATNKRVEGGGEYYIISRSFGLAIGGTIGIALYFSQAISLAFYLIAFAEAFRPLEPLLASFGVIFDPRMVSLPALAVMVWLMLTRGADLGVTALSVVVGVLVAALALFFLGGPLGPAAGERVFTGLADSDPFMLVFAICFPAFTGMTAGVGLSGDLADPKTSIPRGILSATVIGLLVYIVVVIKLWISAPPELLAEDQLVMASIAVWGPAIPIGLACATVSSALGSILVAPRTLQALAGDHIVPMRRLNVALATGVGEKNEPRNATLVTAAIALVVVLLGSVDLVARIVSMFFMVTYGALCTISFLEHFAARPAYRPAFRSRWWASFLGAAACALLMIQMDPLFALLALATMFGTYGALLRVRGGADDLAAIFHGVMTQATRRLQIGLQRVRSQDWRPAVVMISGKTFERRAPLQMLTWLGYKYGFATYLHYLQGRLTPTTYRESRAVQDRLLQLTEVQRTGVYMDTMVSPSMSSALAQTIQTPGVSGMENNSVMFELATQDEDDAFKEVLSGCKLAAAARMNQLVLRHTNQFFGDRRRIDVWITERDYANASLMILLAYILLGHPDWSEGEMRIFSAVAQERAVEGRRRLRSLVAEGRLPISTQNVRVLPIPEDGDLATLVMRRSAESALVVLGFTGPELQEGGAETFRRLPELGDTLFVAAGQPVFID